MSFRPCVIVPVYNHGGPVRVLVTALREYRLPIYLVDDGSNDETREQLRAIAAAEPLVRLLRLARNSGKGGALMHGLGHAWRDGHTHALQIDADGQHDSRDVPRFLAQARNHPQAVVCGAPQYDASAPKPRRYGRYASHVWVWIETLSFAIKDSMCGFRVYPLAATVALIDATSLPPRMDFDTAVTVRLAWGGTPIINVPTRVVYPPGGTSHFDMLRDNVRIIRTHTLLVVGMLWRLPWLLWRKLARRRRAAVHWAQLAERGSDLGLRAMHACYRLFGARAARALLYPIVAYFFIVHRAARVASKNYLCRLYEYVGPTAALAQSPGWRDIWRHLFAFAESTLDKVAAWHGRVDHAHVDFPNRRELDALIATGRGAVLIGAHLGNWEMSRALAHFGGYRTVNAVVYAEHARRFNRLLARTNAAFGVNLIPVATIGPDTAMLLQEKIDNGELLVIVGDRTPPAENGRVTRVPFLGRDAPFPQGPLLLASLLGCPVYLFFCLRENAGYRIHFEPFAERVELPRRRRTEELARHLARYVLRLEHYCARAPYQWFNFYDFWAAPKDTLSRAAPTAPTPGLNHAKS